MSNLVSEENVPLWIESIFYVLYFFVFFFFLGKCKKREIIKLGSGYTILFLCFFVITAIFYFFSGDYFRYQFHVERASEIYRPDTIEFVYQRLALFVQGNYELFRLIVWGGAICLVALSAKILRLNVLFSLMILFILFHDKVCYARATLAMSIYYFGISFLLYLLEKKHYFTIPISLLLMLVSILFHRSMVLLILITPVIFVPLEKKWLRYILLISFVLIAIIISQTEIMSVLMSDDEEYSTKYSKYSSYISSGTYAQYSLKSIVSYLFSYSLFYLPFTFATNTFFKNKNIPLAYKRLFRICFSVFFISTLFFIVYSGFNVYFYRTLFMSMIPLCLILSCLYQNSLLPYKKMRLVLSITFVFMILRYITSVMNL